MIDGAPTGPRIQSARGVEPKGDRAMTYALLFWFLVIITILYGVVWGFYSSPFFTTRGPWAGFIILFILIIILGLHDFGAAIHN
jgi:putative Mn2+ efflux pump MntP